jgi:ATP-binding cassette, subfamily B, bacterial
MVKEKGPLGRLVRYGKRHNLKVFVATIYSILNKIFDLAPPLIIGAAVDVVVSGENSLIASFGYHDINAQLWILAIVSVIIWGGESYFEYLYATKWRSLAQTVQHELRLDAYQHVQTLEMAYFEDRSTGGLLAILNDDVNQLERFLDDGANSLIQIITTIIAVGGYFIYMVPSVSWMAILPMPFVVVGTLLFQRKIAPRYVEVRKQNSNLSGVLSNNLSGISTIKSFTAEKHEIVNIAGISNMYKEKNQWAIGLSAAFVPMIRMVIVVGFSGIMVFAGKLALDGVINVGEYSVLIFMTQRLLWPLTRLGTMLDLYQRAMASTKRVLDLLDTPPMILDGDETISREQVKGNFSFKNVLFHYKSTLEETPDNFPVAINNLSFDIPAGHTVAFIGSTGAGKSTIVKLMLRFYEINSGSIKIDGREIRSLKLADLRNSIGLVSQDVFLFHGTVMENIIYGSFSASENEVFEAAKMAEAHQFILKLPNGYQTIVGERGQKLSGGQRQRISIARAILKNPPILILDEATSSVDNETEAAIQRSMKKIAVGRTTIVIAHRLSTVRNADTIFVLENGEIKENGKHELLLELDGIYANLWKVQTGEKVNN